MHIVRSSSHLLGGGYTHSTPPGCGSEDPPPKCGSGDRPGVDLETSLARPLNPLPGVWAWRPARHAGIPPALVNRMTDTCKNITLLQLHLRVVKKSHAMRLQKHLHNS